MSEQLDQPPVNCPFYGRHVAMTLLGAEPVPKQRLTFVSSDGNQCAIRLTTCTPCELALEGKPVNWQVCPVCRAALVGHKGL